MQTLSSNTAESTTAATSMRKISNGLSPGIAEVKTVSEPQNLEQSEDRKPRFTPNGGTKNLMKQSLERINKAIKRYGKNIGPDNLPGPFELTRNPSSPSQGRENLESEGSSLFGSIIAGDNGSSKLMHNKAFSENIANSIVCDSDTQDIENFTLGPAQFKGFKENQTLMKYESAHKQSGNMEMRRNKKIVPKYSSADRLHNHKRKFLINPEPNQVVLLRQKEEAPSPLVLVNDRDTYFDKDR